MFKKHLSSFFFFNCLLSKLVQRRTIVRLFSKLPLDMGHWRASATSLVNQTQELSCHTLALMGTAPASLSWTAMRLGVPKDGVTSHHLLAPSSFQFNNLAPPVMDQAAFQR